MNDDLMFEYLVQMGAIQPEYQQLKRKQALVDTLREKGNTPAQGQMVSGHYIAPGILGTLNQVASAYQANKQQNELDSKYGSLNSYQKMMLEQMRKKKNGESSMGPGLDSLYFGSSGVAD